MDRERFEHLVARAVKSLPEEFVIRLENIDVVVEDWPTLVQLARARLRRGEHYGLVPPDKITIFQKPIEAKGRHDAEITAEIQRVVQHEIAHHFGIGDARLKQKGLSASSPRPLALNLSLFVALAWAYRIDLGIG